MIGWGFAVVLLATARVCESGVDGVLRPPTANETRSYDLPDGVVVLGAWDAAGIEGGIPKKAEEAMCNGITSARKCMNVSDDAPFYYGRWVC